MLRMQDFKEILQKIGIISLIPVGSTVNKIVRRDNYMIDIILHYIKNDLEKGLTNEE